VLEEKKNNSDSVYVDIKTLCCNIAYSRKE